MPYLFFFHSHLLFKCYIHVICRSVEKRIACYPSCHTAACVSYTQANKQENYFLQHSPTQQPVSLGTLSGKSNQQAFGFLPAPQCEWSNHLSIMELNKPVLKLSDNWRDETITQSRPHITNSDILIFTNFERINRPKHIF
jgi:hypothetical protein